MCVFDFFVDVVLVFRSPGLPQRPPPVPSPKITKTSQQHNVCFEFWFDSFWFSGPPGLPQRDPPGSLSQSENNQTPNHCADPNRFQNQTLAGNTSEINEMFSWNGAVG